MTARERVLAAYAHTEPDRVPVCIGGTAQKFAPAAYFGVKERIGITEVLDDEKELDELGNIIHYHPRVLDYFGSDFRHIHVKRLPAVKINSDGSRVHELGFTLKENPSSGLISFVDHPFHQASLRDLAGFPRPSPDDPRRTEGVKKQAAELFAAGEYAVGMYKATLLGIFDLCCSLRGMDKFLMDLMLDENFAAALIERVFEFTYGVYAALLDEIGEYVDVVEFNDDLGTQDNLILSPGLYRRFFKPFHRKLVEMFTKKAPRAKVMLHSCGAVYDIIPDFIEIGVDILNPIQPQANKMDTGKLKREFGGRLCFQGGIDLQRAMIGSRRDVKEEAAVRIRDLGPGGGYVFATANNIGSDIPLDNIFTLYECAKKFGTYPLS